MTTWILSRGAEGDPELGRTPLPGVAVAIVSKDFPSVPEKELRAAAGAIRDQLAAG